MYTLSKRYYSPSDPISFSHVDKIYKSTNISTKQIQNWLESQDTYTLNKQVRRKFKRNRYYVTTMNELFQCDLIDLRNLAKYNNNVKYLLTVIDVFSKHAMVKPLYTKTGSEVARSFEEIFKERVPINLQTDKGKEFLASKVQSLFKKHDINFYVAKNPDVKAAIVERFNKTLKTKMFKYFSFANTYRYIDVLQDLVKSYNNSYHRTIKMAPNEVCEDNILTVYNNINGNKSPNKPKNKNKLYKVGDFVRIANYKHAFEKGYVNNWSGEIFKITDVILRDPVVYKICDLLNEPVDGVFYQPEIQRVTYNI